MLITVMRVLVFLWGCDEAGIGKFLIYQKKNREKDCQRKKGDRQDRRRTKELIGVQSLELRRYSGK